MSEHRSRVDLVLEGGGVKGIGLAGAYSVLRERGYRAENVAGTSAGAITAAFIAADYSPDELRDIVMSLDYRQFQDRGWEDKIPLFPRTLSLLLDLGIFEGDRFREWMGEMLAAKGIRTFRDLVRDESERDLRYRYSLQVIASDVSGRRLLVLPRDSPVLGLEPDELDVAYAVRMSMSIPIYFEPVRHENPRTGEKQTIVDGGMLSNFPVWLFDCRDDEAPEWPTFGLLLVEPEPRDHLGHRIQKRERGVSALLDYVRALAETMMAAHDRIYVEQADYARTISIPTLGIGTTEFDITPQRAEALYQSGRDAAAKFLATWDFDAYVAEFRSGREGRGRRETLARALAAEGEQSAPHRPQDAVT